MPARSYRAELDGLRAVAVYVVLLFHVGMSSFSGGIVGVDLFFVLSGLLVPQVLLAEVDARGTFSLGRSCARRVRRLLPAAVVAVLAIALLEPLVTTPVSPSASGRTRR